jgi:hypothetical protein
VTSWVPIRPGSSLNWNSGIFFANRMRRPR